MIGAAIVAGLGVAGQLASGLMSAGARRGEFDQQLRSLMLKKDQTLSTALTRAGASGIDVGSASTTNYLRTMSAEFWREIDATRKARNQTFAANLIGTFAGGISGGAGVLSSYLKANPSAPVAKPVYAPGSGEPLWR